MVVSQALFFRSVYSPEIWLGFLAGSGGLIPHVRRKLTSRLLTKAAGGLFQHPVRKIPYWMPSLSD
jgi:hypothetical protein